MQIRIVSVLAFDVKGANPRIVTSWKVSGELNGVKSMTPVCFPLKQPQSPDSVIVDIRDNEIMILTLEK